MNIVAMRVRVTFQKNEVVSDKYGNHKNTWTNHFPCYATAGSNSAINGTGTGSESSGVVIRSVTHGEIQEIVVGKDRERVFGNY